MMNDSEGTYWRGLVFNNAKRIADALKIDGADLPYTEAKARELYLRWCQETDTPAYDVHKLVDVLKDAPVPEVERLKLEIDQLRVQLAGCHVAAIGGISESQVAKKGDWGWSPAYQGVLNLRRKYEELLQEATQND